MYVRTQQISSTTHFTMSLFQIDVLLLYRTVQNFYFNVVFHARDRYDCYYNDISFQNVSFLLPRLQNAGAFVTEHCLFFRFVIYCFYSEKIGCFRKYNRAQCLHFLLKAKLFYGTPSLPLNRWFFHFKYIRNKKQRRRDLCSGCEWYNLFCVQHTRALRIQCIQDCLPQFQFIQVFTQTSRPCSDKHQLAECSKLLL